MTDTKTQNAYQQLGPDQILNAVEDAGFRCDGHISALNSYENRVYQIGLEDEKPIVVKFYRPHRWTDDSIIEEHNFTLELAEHEIAVISPLKDNEGRTLLSTGSMRFAIYPRVGGRAPELDDPMHLMQLGRCVARIHNVGAITSFQHRKRLELSSFVLAAREYLLENDFLPRDLYEAYESISSQLISSLQVRLANLDKLRHIRLHGDCHIGNILWYEDAPFMVDFDDILMGPAIQDLWMFLSGDRAYMTARLNDLLEGYNEFRDFDPQELHILEALRTLRIMHYAGWLARRWDDPAFPLAFPWFNTQQYWQDHILTLREQAAMLEEPPLEVIR